MDRKEISRRLLDFALEIISLLSGEDYTIVKKTSGGIPIIHETGGWSRTPIIHESEELSISLFMEPPPLIHDEKILELTHKMIELLTGEVPKGCQDVAASVSLEKQEHLEKHKDLYLDAMMEDLQPLSKPDSDSDSRRRNSPERCPRPLYSQDCPEEKLPENHQMTNQKKDVTDNNVEDEEERMMVDPLCKSEVEEDLPGDVTTENPSKKPEGNVMLSQDGKVDEDIGQRSSGEDRITSNVLPGLHSTDPSYNQPTREEQSSDQSQIVTTSPDLLPIPSNQKEPTSDQSQIVTTSTGQKGGNSFQCEECGKQFSKSSNLYVHKRIHTGEKSYSPSERGKCFTQMSNVVTREKIHPGEKPGVKPYPCSECGIGFFSKSNLLVHQKSHSGDKPNTYSESVKRFTPMSSLVSHEKIQTAVKPLICSECGKGFSSKTNLMFHQKVHRR